jgi:hypothetical protein
MNSISFLPLLLFSLVSRLVRNEVCKEVFNAPRRRVDNEISRLYESTSALFMHCRILDEITREYNSKLWRTRLRCLAVYGLCIGLTIATSYVCGWVESYEERRSKTDLSVALSPSHHEKLSSHEHKTTTVPKSKPNASSAAPSNVINPAKSEITTSTTSTPSSLSHRFFNYITHFVSQYSVTTLTTCVAGTLSVAFSSLFTYFQWNSLQKYLNSYKQRSSYETIFQRLYAKEVQFHDQFHLSLGTIVVDQMMNNLAYSHDSHSVSKIGFVKKEDLKNLQRILTEDISELRRRASPNFPMLESKPQEGTTTAVAQTPLLLKEKSLFVHQSSQGSDNSSSSSYEMLEGKEFHNKNNVPVNEFSPLSHSLVKNKDALPKETEEDHYMLKNYDHYANINPIQIKSSDIPEAIEMKSLSMKDHTEGLEQEDDRNKSSSTLNSDDNLADT